MNNYKIQINMKKRIYSLPIVLLFSILQTFSFAQGDVNNNQKIIRSLSSMKEEISMKSVPVLTFQKPDVASLLKEDADRDKNGYYYRFGVGISVNISPENSGVWTTKENGDRVWRLKIKYPDANALSFIFSKFQLYGNSKIDVYDESKNHVHLTYTKSNVLETGVQNMSLCKGDFLMLRLVEPKGSRASELQMEKLFYDYRSSGDIGYKEKINESDDCQVNVNCSPEGDDWQDEKRGVAKILIVQGYSQGYCTGSLVNNTDEDCSPYFLTAMHCGVDATAGDLNQWRFYFNYEAPGCSNPSYSNNIPNQYVTGCEKIAASEDVSGSNTISKSDFFLVHMGAQSNETATIQKLKSFDAYWNGWDANNVASPKGVGIHHPAGDIKKISHYTSPLVSTSYSGINSNTHWQVQWSSTANGHGVTEGGSSGSPLFTYNGGNSRIVGTLSGGSSFCDATSSPDLYGKMSYHWTSDGTSTVKQLKPWLDPSNTGDLAINGSSDPCNDGGGSGGGTTDPDPGGPCTANSQGCDEYIARVQLNTIDNTTDCDNYTDYSSISTTLEHGTNYSVAVTPGIIGIGVGNYYGGDVIGVWIDWNNDGDFSDANETIATVAINENSQLQFNFTVPSGVAPGNYKMRVRIDYDPNEMGAIEPCGTTQYGEIEDYKIKVKSNLGLNELSASDAVSIYPNPAIDQVTVDLKSNYKTVNITVYDVSGRIVLTSNNQNKKVVNLDFSDLSSGLYQVAIQTGNGEIMRKLVKK